MFIKYFFFGMHAYLAVEADIELINMSWHVTDSPLIIVPESTVMFITLEPFVKNGSSQL